MQKFDSAKKFIIITFVILQIPNDYKKLILHFNTCLSYATQEKPLIIFLDSLDQLSNEDFGSNLKWLPLNESLPANTCIVVSTLPTKPYDILRGLQPSANFLEVHPLHESDGLPILEKMLQDQGRKVAGNQLEVVLRCFNQCPLPLYLRLVADISARWHSYDIIKDGILAGDMVGIITTIFEKLQAKYGKKLVHHSLGYITAAKRGLSVGELEDILSCDDEVLEEVFVYFSPPVRRIPPLLWIRIRNELGMYLMERGVTSTNCYSWYHRQFWETAEKLFLEQSPDNPNIPFRKKAHQAIADYFEGIYSNGKSYIPKALTKSTGDGSVQSKEPTMADRQVPSQPIVITGSYDAGRQLNVRKLTELPFNIIQLKDWHRFESLVSNLDFIEAKFEIGQGHACLSEFKEAAQLSSNAAIKAMSKFIGMGLSHFIRNPQDVYQLASQQARENIVFQQYKAMNKDRLPVSIIYDINPLQTEDPCEMTLLGHTSGVRSCEYSPDGSLIASCSEDGSLRIWDASSGAEIIAVTDLPGPRYPGLADPYHGERPCCFSRDGTVIATGAEDGTLQIWDLTGGLVCIVCSSYTSYCNTRSYKKL